MPTTIIDDDDELSDFDQGIVGTVCRIEIPLKSPSALTQVADLLRGLANQCEFTASSKETDVRVRMFALMMYARGINRRLKRIKGRGRPPKQLTRYSTDNTI